MFAQIKYLGEKEMKELTLPDTELREEKRAKKKEISIYLKKWRWTLILSLSLASVLLIMGLIISGFAYVEHAELLNKVGTVLVIFAAPLYFLAAHCLDKMDFRKKSDKPESRQKSL